MTQEDKRYLQDKLCHERDKELQLKDLCARLPYNVRVEYNGTIFDVLGIAHGRIMVCLPFMSNTECPLIEEVKPYLFPLSSMTEEQKKEYDSIIYHNIELHCERYYNVIDVDCYEELHDFYHKNHLDYRNLIGIGLAIDATGLNIY